MWPGIGNWVYVHNKWDWYHRNIHGPLKHSDRISKHCLVFLQTTISWLCQTLRCYGTCHCYWWSPQNWSPKTIYGKFCYHGWSPGPSMAAIGGPLPTNGLLFKNLPRRSQSPQIIICCQLYPNTIQRTTKIITNRKQSICGSHTCLGGPYLPEAINTVLWSIHKSQIFPIDTSWNCQYAHKPMLGHKFYVSSTYLRVTKPAKWT